ncbi:MAG TPA: MarR family winged helix-turn-helix transcriptional regulator [Roseomonas sp.]|jgi:DNA-binding MarR family transcriptional regulator
MPPSPSASPCIAAALRAASRRLTLLYDEAMAPSGLRVTQFHILSELARRADAPPSVSEFAEVLTMERSALGQTLRPLERDGLIAFDRDTGDARRRPIRLTPAGIAALARGRPYWAKAHEQAEHFLGRDALAALRATLRGVAEDPRLARLFQPGAEPGSAR